ncbi:MBL fold metallo-hydrolase [Candidatus Woesearchaeota archaeon]|jgi:ribonuclease BN (tRNA processing enzyme)|nr:MBL fold metallo-hydrolase [Candidatus Woesearchaeota archaeon]MBT6518461.1 MBL fold metallo-hydrolase [Candidatus Woesearchaeota archaeon]MBT7367049.1 MBL fold metallo-hydrolase [Candidatus Woesearchaeota archaeon]
MNSLITFLGTGGGRNVVASQELATGGIVLNLNNTQFHLDPGPGSAAYARKYKIDYKKTSVILASHHHIDHANDVNLVIDAITNGRIKKKGHYICNQNAQDNVLTKYHKDALEKISVLNKKSKPILIDGVKISATETKNHDEGIGFKFKTANFCIGYISDTAYSSAIANQFKGCNVLIINNGAPFKKKFKQHFSSEDSVNTIKKIKPKLAILTHFGNSMIQAKPIYEAREIQKQTGTQVVAAYDGMILDLGNYSIEEDQKSLGEY